MSLNLDEPILLKELKERMKLPDRTLFMQTQNAIWALLKFECFPKFKVDYGKSMVSKLNSKILKQIRKAETETVDLYDRFLALTTQNVEMQDFKPTTLPNDEFDEHEKQNLPSINEVWLDRELMLAFREYLYQKQANDNLSFYLATVNYEFLVTDDSLNQNAQEIYEKFIITNAPNMVNLDYDLVSKIEKSLKNSISRTMFQDAQENIYQNLASQWFSDFLMSSLYKACNDETIEFDVTDGGKNRSNTMSNYDEYVKMLRKRNRAKKRLKKEWIQRMKERQKRNNKFCKYPE